MGLSSSVLYIVIVFVIVELSAKVVYEVWVFICREAPAAVA